MSFKVNFFVSGGSHIITPCKFLDEVKALGASVEAEED
jgi:hypothetical protein